MNEFPDNCPTCGDPLPSSGGRHCPKCLFLTTMGATEQSPVGAGAPWTRMGGMELHEEIGRGGMGVVYRARQTKLDRIVAVKVLLGARFAGEEERARFLREAKAAAKLDHPGIVRMFDIGEEDGTLWFSMEHVPGRNMEEDLRLNGQPDPRKAADAVAKLADAVAHAHARGILHRDLKPSNILIDESGHHRITDFGIARLAGPGEDADGLTRSGQMLGSPGYASPEQVLFGRADPRSDVYGLGAILYHLFTGTPPFSGPTLESVVLQLRENEPIRPRVFHTSLHRDLETICLKCLRKTPVTRYANAAEVAADLRRYLAGKPILARPPGAWERTWMWIARHPVVAALLFCVFLLTGGLVTTSLWYARDKTLSEHRSSLLAEARSLRQSRLAGSKTGALEKLKDAWEIRPSREILDETVATLALPELEFAGHSLPPPSDQEQRPDEIPALELDGNFALTRERNSGKLIARFPLPGPAACLATDEAGKVLAFAAPNSGELRLLTPDGRETGKIHHPLPVEDVALAGELIATSCANRFIYIWDKLGNLKHRLSGHDAPAIRIAFRPRTQILASTSADPNIRLWHAARGEEILRLEHAHAAHATLDWSPDGNHLIGTSSNGAHDVYRMTGGEIVAVFSPPQEEPHSENLGSADFHANGRLAIAIDEATGRLWDFERGQIAHSLPKQNGQWLGAKFHPTDPILFTCGWADPLQAWSATRLNPGDPFLHSPALLLDEPGHLLRDVSADGRFLVLSNNATSTCTVVQTNGKKVVTIRQSDVLACALAADGSWLATSSYSQPGLRVWSLPSGHPIADLCSGETILQALLLGPERLLARSSAGLRVFNSSNWSEHPKPLEGIALRSLASTRDGKFLAALGNQDLRIFETTRFSESLRLTPPQHAGWLGDCHLCFDARGDTLFVQTALATVMKWDLRFIHRELDALGMNPR